MSSPIFLSINGKYWMEHRNRLPQVLLSYRSEEQPGRIQCEPQGQTRLGAAGRPVSKVPVPSPCLPPTKRLQPPCHPLCASQRIHSHFQGSEVGPGHLVSLLHHAVELAVHHHAGIWTFTCDSNRSRGGSQIRGFNTPALWGGKRQPRTSPQPVLLILREF